MMRGLLSLRRGREAGPAGSSRLLRTTRTGFAAVLGTLMLAQPCLSQNWGPFEFIRIADQIRAAQQTNPAAEPGLAASDVALLQDALLLHRLSAQFYNINADAAFLTGVTPVTNPPTTPVTNPGATPGTGSGFFNGGTGGTPTTGTGGTGTVVGGAAEGSAGTTPAQTPVTGGSTTPGSTTTPASDTTGNTNDAGNAGNSGNTGAGTGTGTGTIPTGTSGNGAVTTPGSSTNATTSSALTALRSIIQEIRNHHNAHVALLEQALGSNAPQAPTFQNLTAPTLNQFLEMGLMMEDLSVSAHQGMAPMIQSEQVLALMEGIALVEGRHAGALRAYRKIASPAEGGDPNITLTEDGSAVNTPRTREQVMAAIQPFIGNGATLPGTGTGTGTGNNSGTGGNTNTGTNTGTTP